MKKTIALVLCAVMVFCMAACGNKNDEVYDSLVGEYVDSYSGRAMATVEKDDKGLVISVSWGSSATETTQWVMHAKLSKDGTKLEYDDETCNNLVYEDAGVKNIIVYEGKSGSFEIQDSKLAWTGANDENCKPCVFEKQ